MQKNICVFSSSSDHVAPAFFEAAARLGRIIGESNSTLIYGGTNIGLMGAIARATHEHGGRVVGVIPELIRDRGVAYDTADELIITKDLRERKANMEKRADVFIALPGGFGTLEEIVEIITLKQLGCHTKPIIFINTDGFYKHLGDFFEHLYKEKFAKSDFRDLYYIADDVDMVMPYLERYNPEGMSSKW
ncbi:MAG: TIGR00730 family Rossman fold protein [Caulobacteraceae bacterium]